MADGDDPKPSVAPPSETKLAPPAAAGEDPLAGLARMMSDRSAFDPAPAIRRKAVPIPEAVFPTVALANDLETKLRDDLEELLSAFNSHPPPAPDAPTEEPVAAAPKAATAPPAKPQPTAPLAATAAAGRSTASRAERQAPAVSPVDSRRVVRDR